MENPVPFLEDILRAAEKRLSSILSNDCRVDIHFQMEGELVQAVQRIDHEKFRPELQYSLEELRRRGVKEGFVLFMITCRSEATAFLYGYADKKKISTFFLDSVATLVEERGIGSILVTIALMYCHYVGYKCVELFTDNIDEEERGLVNFYEDLGFQVARNDSDKGVIMHCDLEPLKIRYLCEKYIGIEGIPEEWKII